MDFNVEAAFLGRTAADGITFGRIQVTLRDLQASSDYTITHPYGVGARGRVRRAQPASGRTVACAAARSGADGRPVDHDCRRACDKSCLPGTVRP